MGRSELEAGAVVIRHARHAIELLVIRSSDGRNWLFPKGHIESGETAEHAAVREVREEAGVEAIVLAPLGTTDYRRGEKPMRVEFFLLEYVRPVEPDEVREQRWCTCEEVLRWLSFENLKTIAQRACAEAQAHFTDPH